MFLRMRRYCSGIFSSLTHQPNSLTSRRLRTARWCNGSTADSESVCHGSNPCRATKSFALLQKLVRLRVADRFVEIVVAHHHRGGAATREAFDKLDRVFAILRCLRTVRVSIQSQTLTEMFVKFARAAERAAQRAANFQMKFPKRLASEHWIKRDDLVDVDRRQSELLRRPLDRFLRNPAVRFLNRVQPHQRRRSRFVRRILR